MDSTHLRLGIGIDIGGGHVRAARVDCSAARLLGEMIEAATPADAASLARWLCETVASLRRGATAIDLPVGIGVPGVWERSTGVMRRAGNLPFLDGCDIAALFRAAVDGRVRIESDCCAATWAQWRSMPAAPRRFAYVSVGTGIGVGVVLDGVLLRHTRDGAGSWGHVVVDPSPDAPPCRCGDRGCVEVFAAGWSADSPGSADCRTPSAQPAAPHDWPSRAAALALLVRQLAAVYAVECVALGGGAIDADASIVEQVCAAARQRSSTFAVERICRAPRPSGEAGVIGAALLARGDAAS